MVFGGSPIGWMGQVMNGLELLDRDSCIDFCGLDTGVPKHLLNVANVCSILKHESGRRMSKKVTRSMLIDIGSADIF